MSDQPTSAPPPGGTLPGATPSPAPAVPAAEPTAPEFETQPAPAIEAQQVTRPTPPVTPPEQIAPPPPPQPVRTPPPQAPVVQVPAVSSSPEPRRVLTGQAAGKPAVSAAPQPFGSACPRCGGSDFSEGALISYGTRFRPAYYKPARRSIFTLHNALRPFRRLAEVQARVCRQCGYVVFEVDTERLNRIDRPPKQG